MWGNYSKTVMPGVYCSADAEWIQEQLEKFNPAARHKIVALYAHAYQMAWDKEPISYKQENRARHEANSRLREYMKNARSAAGLTEKPPFAKAQAQHGVADSPASAQQDRQ